MLGVVLDDGHKNRSCRNWVSSWPPSPSPPPSPSSLPPPDALLPSCRAADVPLQLLREALQLVLLAGHAHEEAHGRDGLLHLRPSAEHETPPEATPDQRARRAGRAAGARRPGARQLAGGRGTTPVARSAAGRPAGGEERPAAGDAPAGDGLSGGGVEDDALRAVETPAGDALSGEGFQVWRCPEALRYAGTSSVDTLSGGGIEG